MLDEAPRCEEMPEPGLAGKRLEEEMIISLYHSASCRNPIRVQSLFAVSFVYFVYFVSFVV